MALIDKIRTLTLGAALTACGGEPETKYIIINGEEAEMSCDAVATYRASCNTFDGGWQDYYDTCVELNLENTPEGQEWFTCSYGAKCDRDMLKACDAKIDY